MNRPIYRTASIVLIVAAALLFSGCKKAEAPAQAAAPLTAPAGTDDNAWKNYLQDVIKHNMDGVTDRVSPYYLPAQSAADYQGKYDRQLQGVQQVVQRGVLPGNMLVFGSPDSAKMADLVVAAFKDASAGSMKNVIVLFIGKPVDKERVAAAVAPSGATYRFVEAK
jgi:hypothetical protein